MSKILFVKVYKFQSLIIIIDCIFRYMQIVLLTLLSQAMLNYAFYCTVLRFYGHPPKLKRFIFM